MRQSTTKGMMLRGSKDVSQDVLYNVCYQGRRHRGHWQLVPQIFCLCTFFYSCIYNSLVKRLSISRSFITSHDSHVPGQTILITSYVMFVRFCFDVFTLYIFCQFFVCILFHVYGLRCLNERTNERTNEIGLLSS